MRNNKVSSLRDVLFSETIISCLFRIPKLQSEGNTHYYAFKAEGNKYELLEGETTANLLPFEATIAIKTPDASYTVARSISADSGVTGRIQEHSTNIHEYHTTMHNPALPEF